MKRLAPLSLILSLCLSMLIWPAGAQNTNTSNCLQFNVPVVTHGADGHQRVVAGHSLSFVITPPVTVVNIVNAIGGTGPGTLGQGSVQGLATQGMAFSTPNATVTAVSCNDDLWDINLVIRTSGATIGDQIILSHQAAGGATFGTLAVFTVEAGGIRVTDLGTGISHITLSDRSAASNVVSEGGLIPLTRGQTPNITFAMSMNPLIGCEQLVLQIARAGGVGTTTVIVSDLIVKRDAAGGTGTGPGILANGQQTGPVGTYPLGLVCVVVCPSCCPPPPPPDGDEGCSPGYWKNHPEDWTGFSPSTTLGSVFPCLANASPSLASKTFSQALDFGGGNTLDEKRQQLLRQAVAALLNASSPGVDYPLTTQQVLNLVNGVLCGTDKDAIDAVKNRLDRLNNLGCPLS